MRIGGETALAREVAADPEQKAKDNHRKEEKRLLSRISLNSEEVRLMGKTSLPTTVI